VSDDAAEGLVDGGVADLAPLVASIFSESSVGLPFCGVGPPKSWTLAPSGFCIGIAGAELLLPARISAAASKSLFVAIGYLLMISYL
jgi:hypothetical protein